MSEMERVGMYEADREGWLVLMGDPKDEEFVIIDKADAAILSEWQ